MKVIYKCSCMKDEVGIDVPDRLPTTDVVDWMELLVINCIAFDHGQRSPRCQAPATEYVKIPVADENSLIGVPPTLN